MVVDSIAQNRARERVLREIFLFTQPLVPKNWCEGEELTITVETITNFSDSAINMEIRFHYHDCLLRGNMKNYVHDGYLTINLKS